MIMLTLCIGALIYERGHLSFVAGQMFFIYFFIKPNGIREGNGID